MFAGRNRIEMESIIGFFVNTLPIRISINESNEFNYIKLIEQIKNDLLNISDNQNISIQELTTLLKLGGKSNEINPLFQVMFAFQQQINKSIELNNIKSTILEFKNTTSKTDLSLEIFEIKDGIEYEGSFEYNTDLFDESTINRFINHYLQLLKNIVESNYLSIPISRIPMMNETEINKLTIEWNNTKKDYPINSNYYFWII